MKVEMIEVGEKRVMIVADKGVVIRDEDTAMDALLVANYSTNTHLLAIPETAFSDAFFMVKTGLAEKILKQYGDYGFKCAVYGSMGRYANSKTLQTFMRETNKSSFAHFAKNLDAAVEWLVQD